MIKCDCGSGLDRRKLIDARGIFCCYVCAECLVGKSLHYRSEVMTDPNYEADDLGDDEDNWDDYDEESEFADPGGNSALRRATPTNPRNIPCPNCGQANRLTPKDRDLGYQCDECADRLERGWD